jgi:hypothetical protein
MAIPPVAARFAGSKKTPDPMIFPATISITGTSPTFCASLAIEPLLKGRNLVVVNEKKAGIDEGDKSLGSDIRLPFGKFRLLSKTNWRFPNE